MAGLVGYASSGDDEEEDSEEPMSKQQQLQQPPQHPPTASTPTTDQGVTTQDAANHAVSDQPTQNTTLIGPSLPPQQEASAFADGNHGDMLESPQSPYTATRALIHDLTLPAYPDLDIPASPPGSPPARATKKFEQFLALKQKGTHFNAKLEESTALRNPAVMDKLMEFVQLQGTKQYETTLSSHLWNPSCFPQSAYVDRLNKLDQRSNKSQARHRQAATRTSVAFAPASTKTPSEAPLPAGLSRKEDRKDT